VGALDDLTPFGAPPSDARVVLVDLDGTLVRVARRRLTTAMLALGARRFRPLLGPLAFARAYAAATGRVKANESRHTNHELLVDELRRRSGASAGEIEALIDSFVALDMPRMGPCFAPVRGAREMLLVALELGYELVLATNPMWPRAAAQFRLDQGGLGDVPFTFVAHSRVMTRSKPSRDYFAELLRHVGAAPEECVMIGDDPLKDSSGAELGIRTVLVGADDGRAAPARTGPPIGSRAEVGLWLLRARRARLERPRRLGGIAPSIAGES
jgi:FMN phosphatase YigB (HAD superfamily)